jgi:hypothetical protein
VVCVAGCSAWKGGSEEASVDRGSRAPPPPTDSVLGTAAPYPRAGVDCPDAAPAPISVRRAVQALRVEGFTVGEVERSCGLRSISAMLSNAGSGTAPYVMRREGLLSCVVLVEPRPATPYAIDGDTTATSAERMLANLQCRLYGPEAQGFDAYARRLDRAFAQLKRRLGAS